MKRYLLLLLLMCFSLNAQIINFPDANFKAKLLEADVTNIIAKNLSGNYFKIDSNGDGEIDSNEALNVKELKINNTDAISFEGILNFTNIVSLECVQNNLTSLNLNGLLNLQYITCFSNPLGTLDVSGVINLKFLNCCQSELTSLNVSGLAQLESLILFNNQLTSIDISSLISLKNLECFSNQLLNLNVDGLLNLRTIKCYQNQLTILNVDGLINLDRLECFNNSLATLSLSGVTNLKYLICYGNLLSTINVSSLINLTDFYIYNNQLMNIDTSNLVNLKIFLCSQNQLTSLNLTNNSLLSNLNCGYNQLSNLNLSNNILLKKLSFENNTISSIDLNTNSQLEDLNCNFNNLSVLSLANNSLMKSLYCENNQLAVLNVNSSIGLQTFKFSNNLISNIDLSNNINLDYLACSNNRFSTLDLSSNNRLNYLIFNDNNLLVSLFIKNSKSEYLQFLNTPSIQYICADESQLIDVQNKIIDYGYNNCQVNTYCSFTPGGAFYTIQGNNKFDIDNNGCNASDLSLPNLKFNITDGVNSGNLISNYTGNYSINVRAGVHTITPVFENSSYFIASPGNVVVNFPSQISPFTQNFCVTANGLHPDLEIILLPIETPVAGFDVKYKVIYRNKGTNTQSGTVNLTFNDAVLDFVVTNPVLTSQIVNNLSWDFTNLLPFETREIALTLNINSPTETPAVNDGDVLNYTATITSSAIDDLPSDNTFVFNQTVVNSLDPNDKTCLEGATIDPSKVGEYVHYMIRFENNGTANAQNIVVKDMIDAAKFDVSSLVPMKGSHSFVTNITAGNKVEFIFENINLPFDDANNDGYVAFKIKTKPTLVLGNTFSNTASIYFDYNFPIVTNTATTTIAALSRQDFEFSNYFNLYPNPVHDVLNIATTATIEISSINIYNTLGQLVLVIPNAQNTKAVDVSNLTSGNYFIKINSDKGTANTKFIKN
ncbi:T9SS type A sorting domain-containing protein [Flavobacterium sp.]|uniref:DUF7619 domain-containing protein n=1 Tax=Flavobacterium sp. TaxID=239 RepID=UPI00260D7D01|nr:T9SS type A sorting domain-containing protein [Flavobacterium sp.]